MSERFSAWFPLFLLAALAALTFWLDRFVQPPSPARETVARTDPDYVVDTLTATRLAADGSIKHTLTAVKMVHYPNDDSTRLDSPTFVSHAASRAPVTITARTGLVSSEGETIHFHDNVRVLRAPYAGESALEVRTEYLLVIPDENIARTDRAVTITDAHTTVTAVGLELDSEKRILKLLSRVKGTYHDPKRQTRAAPRG
jgi:lipopolysaccharide export system protein LptC